MIFLDTTVITIRLLELSASHTGGNVTDFIIPLPIIPPRLSMILRTALGIQAKVTASFG
jgi:hypothetical protein